MRHIVQRGDIRNLRHMRLIMRKIVIRKDGLLNCMEIRTILQFNINHPAMDAGAKRNCH